MGLWDEDYVASELGSCHVEKLGDWFVLLGSLRGFFFAIVARKAGECWQAEMNKKMIEPLTASTTGTESHSLGKWPNQ